MKDFKFLGIIVLAIVGVIAFREYTEIRKRIEITQTKIDSVADESAKAIRDFNDAVVDLRKKFLRLQELDQETIAKLEQLNQPKQEPTKPAEPTVVVKEHTPTITMHTDGNCGECNRWWTSERGKWTSQGWTVEQATDISGSRPLPWFTIIERSGNTFEVDGPLTNDSFFAAQKVVAALEPLGVDDLGLPPVQTTFAAAPSTGPPPRIITWDLATQYRNGTYNGTFDFAGIDYALNMLGRYWNLEFRRVTRGGQYHVIQANTNPNSTWAAWNRGSETYVNPVYNFGRNKALCGMVMLHEFFHTGGKNHHAQDGGLMGPNGGYLLLATDYPYMTRFPWKSTLRPTQEPAWMKQYLSGGTFASGVDEEAAFPLLRCEHN